MDFTWWSLRRSKDRPGSGEKSIRKEVRKLERKIRECRSRGDSPNEGRSLEKIGFLYFDGDELDMAIRYWTEALRVYQEMNDRCAMAESLSNIGTARRLSGDLRQAARYYNKALVLDREFNKGNGELTSLHNLGATWLDLGEHENAYESYKEALEISRDNRDAKWVCLSLYRLGLTCLSAHKYRESFHFFSEAIDAADAIPNLEILTRSTFGMGECYAYLGDYSQAVMCYADAQEGAVNIGDKDLECIIRITQAQLLIHIGFFDDAREIARKLEKELPAQPTKILQIENALLRARIYYIYRMEENAVKQLDIAESVAKELPYGYHFARILLQKAELKLRNNYFESALGLIFQITGKFQESKSLLIDIQVALLLGQIYRGLKQDRKALKYRESAARKAHIIGIPRYLWGAQHSLGRFYHHQRRYDLAREQYQTALKWIDQTADNLDPAQKQVFLHHKERLQVYQDYVILLITSGHKEQAARILNRLGSDELMKKVQHFFNGDG